MLEPDIEKVTFWNSTRELFTGVYCMGGPPWPPLFPNHLFSNAGAATEGRPYNQPFRAQFPFGHAASNRLLLKRSCPSSQVRESVKPVAAASSRMPFMSYL